MSMENLIELFKTNNIKVKGEISEEKTLSEIGIDSLDTMMVTYSIAETTGKELELNKSHTLRSILAMINAETSE